MNAILGARIKSLRESKGFTQEQLAEKMNCSRQKYARLEKGLIDISFASISAIAQILGTKIDEITSAVSIEKVEEPMFRGSSGYGQEDKFLFINNMLDTFYAHRKLYNSVRQVEVNE
ncbi:helix-turn-helix transcriptional regulator [Alkaliphilus serpentinus]|uniref:Helix-turn-helix transcriptional regulator n=1 Tax=Alkaliphilus serpentinus TaxID=1482731 RepID=A0A833MD71_9FIRM|nr:helix-turn-helix transcriptional regulator [Alkaliphilus serpentinus]KAB3527453.1 helix-turn-helix transcriptional regulator [Alkaliphilus serpentinus]